MKKTPFITIAVLLVSILVIFSSCEMSFDINKKDDVDASGSVNGTNEVEEYITVVATDESGVAVTDKKGETVYETVKVTKATEEYITVVATDKSGVAVTDKKGETVYETVKVTNPIVTVVEVTNKKGDVVATEKITLSNQEVQDGKDFFDVQGTEKDTTAVPTGVASERLTQEDKIEEVQDDLEVLNSNKYTINARIVTADGSYIYKVARDGNKMAIATSAEGKEIGVIVGDSGLYMLSSSSKSYFLFPRALMEDAAASNEEFKGILDGSAFDSQRKETSRENKKIDGIEYTLVTYEDGSVDYLNGKTLIKTVAEDGGITYYDSITPEVSAGVFVPPANYVQSDLNEENLSEFANSFGMAETTTHIHKDDE